MFRFWGVREATPEAISPVGIFEETAMQSGTRESEKRVAATPASITMLQKEGYNVVSWPLFIHDASSEGVLYRYVWGGPTFFFDWRDQKKQLYFKCRGQRKAGAWKGAIWSWGFFLDPFIAGNDLELALVNGW